MRIAPDKHRFKRVWMSDRDTTALLKSLCKGRTLNLCCGATLIGDVNVDTYPQYPSVIKADITDQCVQENHKKKEGANNPFKTRC